jgi:hypothetical protein
MAIGVGDGRPADSVGLPFYFPGNEVRRDQLLPRFRTVNMFTNH